MTAAAVDVVILISGNGSNLQAIIDASASSDLAARVVAVVSNEPSAYGLERARSAGIAHHVVDHRDFATRTEFERQLMATIDRYRPGLVVLAGFMRILGMEFIRHYQHRMINIHPSLLPRYPGLNTHARAIANHDDHHGASVHFVTEDLDAGPVIIQGQVPVHDDDRPADLQQRVHQVEHQILPRAIQWFASNRLQIQAGKVFLDGKMQPEQGITQ